MLTDLYGIPIIQFVCTELEYNLYRYAIIAVMLRCYKITYTPIEFEIIWNTTVNVSFMVLVRF
jgi:hypothetical protein